MRCIYILGLVVVSLQFLACEQTCNSPIPEENKKNTEIEFYSLDFNVIVSLLESSSEIEGGIFLALTTIDPETVEVIIGDSIDSLAGGGEIITLKLREGKWGIVKIESADF